MNELHGQVVAEAKDRDRSFIQLGQAWQAGAARELQPESQTAARLQ